MNEKRVKSFLVKLGLDHFEAVIYLVLTQNGIMTTLEIARSTGIDRSKIYRRLEHMKKIGVVEEVIDQNKKRSKAVNIDRLEFLLNKRVRETEVLKKTFSNVKLFLSGSVGLNDPKTKVLFYRGSAGIKQMVWNVLRAKKEAVGYTYRSLTEVTGNVFRKRWQKEFLRRGLVYRDIYSDEYLESKNKYSEIWFPKERFKSKYISSSVLDISHQLDIYNDVVGIYNWYEGEVFGVEIYNKKISTMQRQIFEIIWGRAQKEN